MNKYQLSDKIKIELELTPLEADLLQSLSVYCAGWSSGDVKKNVEKIE